MTDSRTTATLQPGSSVLYRSRIEIGRILHGLSEERAAVFAYIADREDEHLFISNIHSVQPDADNFVLSYGQQKSVNSALFRHTTLKFKANFRGGRVAFLAHRPLDATLGGQPMVKFVLPQMLLHYYREYTRISVPGESSLHCMVDGPDDFLLEMKVIDISLDGMGCILHQEGNRLQKGMVLKNCRIALPNGKTVRADLMVRHSQPITLKDGKVACRTGVRFVQTPQEIKPLIDQFIHVIDDQ